MDNSRKAEIAQVLAMFGGVRVDQVYWFPKDALTKPK